MLGSCIRTLCAAAAVLALGACNTSLDDNNSSSTTASATGVWSGSDSVTGLGVTAIINSAGQAVFLRSDGVQFAGNVQVSGTTLAATVDGYSDFPNNFSDGSNYGIGTVNGSVSTAGTISATLSFTTSDNSAITGSWSLTYESLSSSGSSTSAVSGNFTDTVNGTVLSITSSGVLSSQNSSNNCVLNGSISTNDTTTDVYEVAYTYADCTGTDALLNGVQFTGLATLNTSAATLTIAVSGASPSTKYGLVSTLTS